MVNEIPENKFKDVSVTHIYKSSSQQTLSRMGFKIKG